MLELKDLAGLSKPLTRLIEVVSAGIGRSASAHLIRRDADAKAYEIRAIGAALGEVASMQLPISYKSGLLEIDPPERPSSLPIPTLAERAQQRLDHLEQRRQQNIEDVILVSASELAHEGEVPEAKPEEDWIARFFNSAQDISSEQMKFLWGRVLADEIRRPGSYSARTLDLLRNMTREDAELLEHLGRLAISTEGRRFIFVGSHPWLARERNVYPIHLYGLGEMGALYPTPQNFNIFSNVKEENFELGNSRLRLLLETQPHEIGVPMWSFTKAGTELLQLVTSTRDDDYLMDFARYCAYTASAEEDGITATIFSNGAPNESGELVYEKVRTLGEEGFPIMPSDDTG